MRMSTIRISTYGIQFKMQVNFRLFAKVIYGKQCFSKLGRLEFHVWSCPCVCVCMLFNPLKFL